jgi:hypothetical protein
MRCMSLLLLTAALGACTTGPQPGRSAEAEAHLQQLLAGKVAARPVSCLAHYRSNDMVVIDDGTVVFKNGRTVYRNDFQGGSCDQLGRGHYALVTRTSGGGLCRGDIAEVRDLSAGITVGSCVLGDFVPYATPRG